MVFGQDPAQDVRDLIDSAQEEFGDYIDPLVSRLNAYSNSFGEEFRTLQGEYIELRGYLTDVYNQYYDGNPDIYTCYSTSIQDSFSVFQARSTYNLVILLPLSLGLAVSEPLSYML